MSRRTRPGRGRCNWSQLVPRLRIEYARLHTVSKRRKQTPHTPWGRVFIVGGRWKGKMGYYDDDEDGAYCVVYPDGVMATSWCGRAASWKRRKSRVRFTERIRSSQVWSLSPEEICVLVETSGRVPASCCLGPCAPMCLCAPPVILRS